MQEQSLNDKKFIDDKFENDLSININENTKIDSSMNFDVSNEQQILNEQDEKLENEELNDNIGTSEICFSEDNKIASCINEVEFKKVNEPNLWIRFVKRTFDFCSSLFVILLLSPFFLIFTPIVAIAMKGNPFFVQARPGKNEKVFKMIKYRTMTNAKDADGNLLPDSERLTKFGRIMRSLSIDELPELFNILVGNMSVVGPRPLLVKYLSRYNDFQKQRHLVRPGLTGLAQVSGRNAISWEQKFEKDVEYIEKMSFWGDLKIIFLTIKKVLVRDGISQDGEATMEEFFNTNN